jgi:uncharacterized membrane protein (DUF373 family)
MTDLHVHNVFTNFLQISVLLQIYWNIYTNLLDSEVDIGNAVL